MPFINGRFYMNPAYGRAVERTRGPQAAPERSGPQQQGQGAHWVTIDGKHVLIHETQAGQARRLAKHEDAQRRKVIKIYNETSGLRPKSGVTTDANLSQARLNIAHVYNNLNGRGFQGSSTLGPDDARDINKPGTDAATYYQDTKDAVEEASTEPDSTQNANHVYLYDPAAIHSGRIKPPSWVTQGQTTTIQGPFINQGGGGDIPQGDEVFVITVNDRNMRYPDGDQ